MPNSILYLTLMLGLSMIYLVPTCCGVRLATKKARKGNYVGMFGEFMLAGIWLFVPLLCLSEIHLKSELGPNLGGWASIFVLYGGPVTIAWVFARRVRLCRVVV